MWQFRFPTWLVLFVFALLVQTALLPVIFPVGYVPSMVLPVVVLIAVYETPRRGLAAGLLGGLMMDVWSGRTWGLNALTYAFIGYLVAILQGKIVRDQVFVPGLLAGVAQVAATPLQWVLLRVAGYHFAWLGFVRPLPSSVLFAMLMTPAIGGILRFRSRHEIESMYGPDL
ncbi:MAG: rod shape-determining protein MreD [Thermaerobacter sp.]|nr:rod shape-determining protein MreD [Thermaerobacter sp.]